MSYLSFNLTYYEAKLQQYEQHVCNEEELYEARQLLKLLDDLVDEGYSELCREMEQRYHGVTRLRQLLFTYHMTPFPVLRDKIPTDAFGYREIELKRYLGQIMTQTRMTKTSSNNPFLNEMLCYASWIDYVPDCTYVFLLRDALLPYLYFKIHNRSNIEPWLIGRKYMDLLYPGCHIDDLIRASMLDALECNYNDYQSFYLYCKYRILQDLAPYPEVILHIKRLLSTIQTSKILVVESGCYGTFPMLLSVLDERVEFTMYTTVPYLYDIYKDRIYTKAYENNRLFETLTCQDRLFQLSSIHDDSFYVKVNHDTTVVEQSLQELRRIENEY